MPPTDTRDHEYAAERASGVESSPPTSPMPFCPLYETRFRVFPPNCPLAHPKPVARLNMTLRVAWGLLGRETGSSVGLMGLDAADKCGVCVGPLLGHPWVRFLRKKYSGA